MSIQNSSELNDWKARAIAAEALAKALMKSIKKHGNLDLLNNSSDISNDARSFVRASDNPEIADAIFNQIDNLYQDMRF